MPADSPAPSLVDQLLALRDHYSTLVATHEQQAAYAREQLTHLNALLIDQLAPAHETQLATDSLTDSPPLALQAARSEGPNDMTQPLSPANAMIAAAKTPTPRSQQTTAQPAAKQPAAEPHLEPMGALPDHEAEPENSPVVKPQTVESQATETPVQQDSKIILPLQPAYVGLTKIDAVTQIMTEQAGKIFHIDDLIHELFGDLSVDDLKAERGRLKNVMNRGMQQNRWIKVAQVPSSYMVGSILEPASPESGAAKPQKRGKSRRRRTPAND